MLSWCVSLAKIQISLHIGAVWSESLLGTFWIAKNAKFLHADIEGSDHSGQMLRLIWVFTGCISESMFSYFADQIVFQYFIQHCIL